MRWGKRRHRKPDELRARRSERASGSPPRCARSRAGDARAPLEERALFHIACSDAAQACAESVDLVAEAAGSSSNAVGAPLERLARDARVIRQHVTVAPSLIDDAGRALLGLEPESFLLRVSS